MEHDWHFTCNVKNNAKRRTSLWHFIPNLAGFRKKTFSEEYEWLVSFSFWWFLCISFKKEQSQIFLQNSSNWVWQAMEQFWQFGLKKTLIIFLWSVSSFPLKNRFFSRENFVLSKCVCQLSQKSCLVRCCDKSCLRFHVVAKVLSGCSGFQACCDALRLTFQSTFQSVKTLSRFVKDYHVLSTILIFSSAHTQTHTHANPWHYTCTKHVHDHTHITKTQQLQKNHFTKHPAPAGNYICQPTFFSKQIWRHHGCWELCRSYAISIWPRAGLSGQSCCHTEQLPRYWREDWPHGLQRRQQSQVAPPDYHAVSFFSDEYAYSIPRQYTR